MIDCNKQIYILGIVSSHVEQYIGPVLICLFLSLSKTFSANK